MNSPFYEIEQKRLYPHRKDCRNAQEVKEHTKTLIDNKVTTLEAIKEISFGELKHQFFLNVNDFEISDGIRLYEKVSELQKLFEDGISLYSKAIEDTITAYQNNKIPENEYRSKIQKYDTWLSEQKQKLSDLNKSNMHPIF